MIVTRNLGAMRLATIGDRHTDDEMDSAVASRAKQTLMNIPASPENETASSVAALPHKVLDPRFALTPSLLGDRLPSLRVLLMGTCQIGPLVAAAPALGYTADHILVESYRHSTIPEIDMAPYDAAVMALTLRHLLADATGKPIGPSDMHLARITSSDEFDSLLAESEKLLFEKMSAFDQLMKGPPIFFLSYIEPSFNYLGNMIDRYDPLSATSFMRKLNEALYRTTRQFSNIHFIDSNELINFVGRWQLNDDGVCSSSHASFISDVDVDMDKNRLIPPISNYITYNVAGKVQSYGELFWRYLADNVKVLRQSNQVKLIIVDLDDTLWRGIAAEDSLPIWERTEGWPLGFVESLLYFKKRGGLLAICSKNDRDATLARLEVIWRGAIAADDFVSIKINWEPKSKNVSEILAETNLLAQNTVFIDDNPRELDEVKSQHPSIRCLGGNHYDWRRIIMLSPETQVPFVTAESAQRTRLVQAHVERQNLALKMSRQEWLSSLKIEQDFWILKGEGPDFDRAFELINKTNQFNTTGRRWTRSEMLEFLSSGGVCLVSSLRDSTVDNGIISAALIGNGEVVQVVLSCRVFDLGAEIGIGRMATILALKQSPMARAKIIDTGKNFACHKYFISIGYEDMGTHFEAALPCEFPAWIKTSGIRNEQ